MQVEFAQIREAWLTQACQGLALCITSATALLDLDAVVVDGSISPMLLQAVLARTQSRLQEMRFDGIQRPTLMQGQIGTSARALGGSLLPLHASAIATSRGAVVFMGNSGRGKSTLAAHFAKRGFRVLADDIAVIRFDDAGRPLAEPGLPQFKLWPNSVAELGEDTAALPRLRPQMEKRTLAFSESFHREPLPIARIFALEADNQSRDIRLSPQPVLDRVRLLLDHTYRAQYLPGLGLQKAHFQSLSRVAAAVPVARVTRPDDGKFRLAELADLLVADFSQ